MAKPLPTFFYVFVFATFVSNLGTWLFNIGAGWLMTELGGSALMVSLVQSAALLPLFLLAVPAGTIGDLYDRKRIVIWSHVGMIANTAAFAYLVYADLVSPVLLLVFTLLNGVGAAFARPVLSAIIPQIVDRSGLRSAMNISSVSFNLSRAIGPVLAGILITQGSIDLPFWADALSFAAVVVAILFWSSGRETEAKDRDLGSAMISGIRFLRYTPALSNSLWRATIFFLGSGALWALMPLIARERLAGEADLYGYLVGGAGAGAVIIGLTSNKINEVIDSNRLTVVASVAMGVSLIALGWTKLPAVAIAASVVAGGCWQVGFTSLITSAQYALPKWYGARGMAFYTMAMAASLALGSALWGGIADLTTIPIGIFAAAGLCIGSAPFGLRFPLDQARDADLRAVSGHGYPHPPDDGRADTGMVVVRRTYRYGKEVDAEEIRKRVAKLKNKRYRAGALRWHLFREYDEDGILVETFTQPSWSALENASERLTREDADAIEAVAEWIKEHGGEIEERYWVEA